ncbi:hypothetical protein GDO78_018032 [Eleutherodactylus coqui]|uniref:Uncharacterized protein n=1 Tax=Eleutherodactylus coqui TaxID=57060 RepID=A0A8J6EJY5_ELECQ|nr:hypothetical protein GDO78_018032 [Eleutherodactylus coqui]
MAGTFGPLISLCKRTRVSRLWMHRVHEELQPSGKMEEAVEMMDPWHQMISLPSSLPGPQDNCMLYIGVATPCGHVADTNPYMFMGVKNSQVSATIFCPQRSLIYCNGGHYITE